MVALDATLSSGDRGTEPLRKQRDVPVGPMEQAKRFRRAQWRILLVTMFCYLFYYTGRQAFGFAIPGMERDLGLSKATLGWISTAMLWSYAIGQAINGNLGDRYGGRVMMSLGAWLSCGFNWMVSFSTGALSAAIPWSANGFVQSMGWAPGSRVLSNWWSATERGRVYGAYVFAAGSASVVTYITSNLILAADLSWRWIFRLPVLLLLIGGAAYYLLVRNTPEEMGFQSPDPPDADKPVEVTEAGIESEAAEETFWQRYREALTHWRFLIASVSIGFQSMARYGLLIWVPVHFLGGDWKANSSSGWISVALPVGMALGAIASGWGSDRLFRSNRSIPIVLFMALAAVCSLVMYQLPVGSWLSIPLLFLCGFFAYGPQAAFWALCPDLLGTRRAGTGTGVMNTSAYAFAGLGEPLIGWMIESNGNRTEIIFAVVALACLASAICALFIRR